MICVSSLRSLRFSFPAADVASRHVSGDSLLIGRPRQMTRLAWLTDIHLNFLRPAELKTFFDSLPQADAFVITGDIGEAHDVLAHLRTFADRGPTYFVLGNHDFYRGSIAGIRAEVSALC